MELCNTLERGLDATTEQIAGALARVQAVTEPEPTRSVAAERTRRWGEKQRAEADAAAAQQEGDAA